MTTAAEIDWLSLTEEEVGLLERRVVTTAAEIHWLSLTEEEVGLLERRESTTPLLAEILLAQEQLEPRQSREESQ